MAAWRLPKYDLGHISPNNSDLESPSQQPDFSVRHWVAIQPFTNEEERIEFEQALLLAGLPP
jgi:hypothetical protein